MNVEISESSTAILHDDTLNNRKVKMDQAWNRKCKSCGRFTVR